VSKKKYYKNILFLNISFALPITVSSSAANWMANSYYGYYTQVQYQQNINVPYHFADNGNDFPPMDVWQIACIALHECAARIGRVYGSGTVVGYVAHVADQFDPTTKCHTLRGPV
jgi:hypothetical protein